MLFAIRHTLGFRQIDPKWGVDSLVQYPDGDHLAADNTRSNTSLGTGWSVNPRTARRLVTAS